jgi:hypothetical protein
MVGSNMDFLLAAATAKQEEMVLESCGDYDETSVEENQWTGAQEGEETAEVLDLVDDDEQTNDAIICSSFFSSETPVSVNLACFYDLLMIRTPSLTFRQSVSTL